MPLKTYLWLVEHWQAANDVQKINDVLAGSPKNVLPRTRISSVLNSFWDRYLPHDDCKKAFEQYDAVINGDKMRCLQGDARG